MSTSPTSAASQLSANALHQGHGTPTDKYKGLTGAQAFHRLMAEHGVDTIFGYPGGAILPVFDAIHQAEAVSYTHLTLPTKA